eukprot:TRINITY_DN39237_c0_g1_i1.p2 TRINITY_DN39237_c0_g1~~TRINITY_DN39237_c0_g1_i1.p2  ORF type:complete len:148 (+),score=35.98 TRINITY_DN39237_c0_g1_i1:68-511(+)
MVKGTYNKKDWSSGKGGSGGKGGMYVWIPNTTTWGKGSKGKGGSKGAGKNSTAAFFKKASADKKIWISGLPEGMSKGPKLDKLNKELQKHLSQDGIKCQLADIWKNGNGSACFATAKDASKAVESLNGSLFNDSVLSIDVWTKTDDA